MLLHRPFHFLMLCLALLVAQEVLIAALAWHLWPTANAWVRHGLFLGLAAGVVHGAILLEQLPRATLWRPRRSVRPGAEVRRERQRIARELHDRVGAQIVNALALFDAEKPGEALQRSALERGLLELRLLVDTMDDPGRTSGEQLAQLRYRMAPVLSRSQLVVAWDIEAADQLGAPSGPLLAVIAQEALSNVIQHAKASHVQVSLQRLVGPARWQFQVCDDGCGLTLGSTGGAVHPGGVGFGLESMKERVRQAGGEFQVLPAALGGTCIRAVFAAVS